METFLAYACPIISTLSSLDSISVARVMRSQVWTIKESDTLQQACKTMVQKNIGSVIVTQSDRPQVSEGIITERDIVKHIAENAISSAAMANQIMSKPVVTIHPNASVRDALQTMHAMDIRRLVVVSDNGTNIAGILTDKDIIRFIARNEPVSSSVITEQALGSDREMTDRFSSNLLDDIINRKV